MERMPNIYLVGFMGAGKSQIGSALAREIGFDFLDLDDRLEDELGMSIREVFDRFGEAHFRVAERQALQRSTGLEDTVVATGGGAFCSPANREVIHGAGGRSIFLDVPFEVLAERVGGDRTERPKFVGMQEARDLYAERRPHYLQATWTVFLDGSEPPREVARRIVGVMAGAACAT